MTVGKPRSRDRASVLASLDPDAGPSYAPESVPQRRQDAPSRPETPDHSLPRVETPAPPTTAPPRKFTAQLDVLTDERFGRITSHVGQKLGRIAGRRQDGAKGGRLPSRADVLRALVALAEDPDVLERVTEITESQIIDRREVAESERSNGRTL